ncbi:hypothetical protein Taro_050910, partial [Colocasia esculenta]|nr:hypothetical protein [Colocasia esculenta]
LSSITAILRRPARGRYQRRNTCYCLPGKVRSLVQVPKELFGHGKPVCVLLRPRLVLLLLLPTCHCYCRCRCSLRLSDTNYNDPRTRPSAYAEDLIFPIAAHGSGDPEGQ